MPRKNKRKKAMQTDHLRLIENIPPKVARHMQLAHIEPRSINQCNLLSMLKNPNIHIAFATGPAGTGKTLISTIHAINCLKAKIVKKIVITRPAVSVDEQHGFLPGSLSEKMAPWTRPIFDIFEEHYSKQLIEQMIEHGVIEISPLAYMRGRTFKNSIIIADEMQNATDSQMKMLLTRIGENSKLIITGDLAQHDRGFESNGLKLFIERLVQYDSDMIDYVEFTANDVERHPAVSDVLRIYNGIHSQTQEYHYPYG
tara:strand:+ start:697 stop:1464 length:768 start_codon:yes stop_codon:yes gene_type:complete